MKIINEMNDLFIILTASLVAINASVLGVFLVLRKMSMMGDAISHSVLPGIVVAYYFSGDRTSPLLLLGATITGVLTAVLIDWLSSKAKIQNDASIGITYTLLFALGMIMISGWFSGNVDIDLDCVLYGDIALINLDKVIVDENLYLGPSAFLIELSATVIVLLFVFFGFRGFKLLAFNEDFGLSLGMNMNRWHFVMMGLVSLVTVVSFEVVGAVLVVGFLIIPAATAHLLTNKLIPMIFWACGLGVIAVIIGFYLAVWLNVSYTGAMVTVSGLLFFTVVLVVVLRKKRLSGEYLH
ncbi:MAG: metal ABC transporter permease [Crocinitomicaceae bacterium]|nr:metal ABC transporter permease [Crocinitomicaceae bacterium]